MKVSIMDYGVGNLHSISKGLERAGANVQVVEDPEALLEAECMVFPGVGAFGAAMEVLRPVLFELRMKIREGTPVLGVCLGMQILFERSEESRGEGLAVFRGDVKKLRQGRVPQMGWNDVFPTNDRLFEGVPAGSQFYFANSYICHPTDNVTIADSIYGDRFASAVRDGPVFGVQFHPEKSGVPGLKLLSNFARIAEESS